ncbi:branched-chain amino acid transport system permease protein [Haloplanus vescus]|uniref:Branched-chain amino acid transport system permease protein n=1 Tax=Haloplanus vescus TaxID=555874 RepID=A0A1H3WI49_9EURY|nr:branched-chain amino acid ABC transporter permease [Haloplanus vescus]SDZ85908.1 branched-chain amino acid transport system permease protein [Haloplanus vescus]
MSFHIEAITVLLNGLQQGAIYILLAVGLSIILGTLKFVNFAHGALYLIGTYAGLLIALEVNLTSGLLQEWGYGQLGLGLGYIPALIIVPFVVFVVGLAMERWVVEPFKDRPDTDQILVTFGLAIVVQEVFRTFFGSSSLPFSQPSWAEGAPQVPFLAQIPISSWRYYVIVITAVLVAIVYLLVEYTDFGLIVRAGTRDPEMVELLGIRLSRPYIIVFGIGAALAGVAGVVGGPLNPVNPTIGNDILVPAFLTVVIGGVGSIAGATLGGVLFGLTYAILVATFSSWAQVGLYAIAAVVLLVRPQGLLGEEGVAP